MRLVVPLFLLFIAIKATEYVAERIQVQIDYTWFWVGVIVTVIVAAVNFAITNWWGTVSRPSHTQSITHHTSETPSQITWTSFWAIIEAIVIIIVIGVIVYQVLLIP